MADKGFAIRCPHCGKWNENSETHPREIALCSVDDFEYIMNEFRIARAEGRSDDFKHEKLLRCTCPRWSCLASFEAFIFGEEDTALECLKRVPEAWAISRDFRLFKSDKRNRWDKEGEEHYYCIMFCTEPVTRQQEIELEHLMDRELVSRTITGIGAEIESPFTIYAANIFELEGSDPKIYWMPVEAYSQGKVLVPPNYNKFCYTCREIVMTKLEKEFLDGDVRPDNCPIGFGNNGRCAGREAACLIKDWNHCPAFIEERKKRCPCYDSDLAVIEELREKWIGGKIILDGVEHRCGVPHRCYAEFREWAFPIIVHGHLDGVAMTGQVFFNEEELVDIDKFIKIKNWGGLQDSNSKFRLKVAQNVLLFGERQQLSKDEQARFLISEDQFKERRKQLKQSVAKIEEMANVRYRDLRTRSENAFRQEILALIQRFKKAANFFQGPILDVLKRMRKFWSFRNVGFLWHSPHTSDLRLIAFSSDVGENNGALGFPGDDVGKIPLAYRQRHPLHWLCDPGDPEDPRNKWLKQFLQVIEDVKKYSNFYLPEKALYFLVVIPFGKETYAFAFIDREPTEIDGLGMLSAGGVSELCQEFMLRTCTEVMHEFGDVDAFREFRRKPRIDRSVPLAIKEDTPSGKGRGRGVSQRDRETKAGEEKA